MDIHAIATADGLQLHLAYEPPKTPDGLVLLGTHGINSSFYTTPLLELGRRLAADGLGYAILNNRGHDRMSMTSGKMLGTAYETFEDCVLDLNAAADWLTARGHTRLMLAGHSLGALKVTYMQAHQPHPSVVALAPCSGPAVMADYAPDQVDAWLAESKALIAAGKGDEVIWAQPPGDSPAPRSAFSAHTYWNKYAPGANTRILQYITKVRVPTLFIAGAKEPRFAKHAHDLHAALSGAVPTIVSMISDANHNYTGREDEVASVFRTWIRTLPSPAAGEAPLP